MKTNTKRYITASFFLGYFNTLSNCEQNELHSISNQDINVKHIIGYLNFFKDDFYRMIYNKNDQLFYDFFNESSYSLSKADLLSIVDFVKCNYFDINYISLLLGEYLALIDFNSFEIFDEKKLRMIINEVFTNLDLKISWKKISSLTTNLQSSENLDQQSAKNFIFGSMLTAANTDSKHFSNFDMPTTLN